MKNENLNNYKLKANPEQVFNLTTEQREMVEDALFYAINFIKRPAMMATVYPDDSEKLTKRERGIFKFFSELIQSQIVFKWINEPDNKNDILDVMEEINLYLKHRSINKLDEYTQFQLKHKFPGWEINVERPYAWMQARKDWDIKEKES